MLLLDFNFSLHINFDSDCIFFLKKKMSKIKFTHFKSEKSTIFYSKFIVFHSYFNRLRLPLLSILSVKKNWARIFLDNKYEKMILAYKIKFSIVIALEENIFFIFKSKTELFPLRCQNIISFTCSDLVNISSFTRPY